MTGDEFTAIRLRLGLTGEDFARALGYAGTVQTRRTTVYQFESGRRPIPRTVARLAAMFDRHGVPDAWQGMENDHAA